MNPQGTITKPVRFSAKFEEDCGRWRLRYFLYGRIHVIEGTEFVTYKVTLHEGKKEDQLYDFAVKNLKGKEIPPIQPEAAGDRALKLLQAAESEGLVSVEKVFSSHIKGKQ